MAAIIVDDAKLLAGSNLAGAQWESQATATNSFNRTISVCRTGLGGATPPPSLSYTFAGTAFSLVGRPTDDLGLTYSIDGSSPTPVSLETDDIDMTDQEGVVLFSVDGLSPAQHSIQIFPVAGSLYLDYITYVPYNLSAHVGEDVVVDDQDSSITYSGTWRPSFGSATPVGDPYNETWSQTRRAGSSFKTDFTGSSVAVYGALRPMSGRLTATYAIDNGTPQSVVHFDGTQTTTPEGSVAWGMNQIFYRGDLTPGPHTITVTVTEVTETQEYFFDYITYKASEQAPVIPTDTPTTPGSSGTTSRKMSKGAIAGAVVGSVVGFLLLLLLLFWFLKRRRDRRNDGDAEKGAAAESKEEEEDDKDKASGSLPPWTPPHLDAGTPAKPATPSDGQSLLKDGEIVETSATPPPASTGEALPASASTKPDTPSDGEALPKEGSDAEQEKPESATPAPATPDPATPDPATPSPATPPPANT